MILGKRIGYKSKYIQEHRLVASKAIGRLVRRGEEVIRLNRKTNDNSPENLYICESSSERLKLYAGSLPWPERSNLSDYALRERAIEAKGL